MHQANLAAATDEHSSSHYSNVDLTSICWFECYVKERLVSLVFSEFHYSVSGYKQIFAILVSVKFKGRFGSGQNVAHATFPYLLTRCTFWAESVEQLLKNCDVRDSGRPGTEAALPRYTPQVLRRALYLDMWSTRELL